MIGRVASARSLDHEVRRRDAILEAIAFAAERLLATPDWQAPIQDVLDRLGAATEVSRVYIFENHAGHQGELLTSQRYEWVAPGISSQLDNPALQNFPYVAAGFGRWVEVLGGGGLIQGDVEDFPACERNVLAAHDIRSMVVVPVFVDHGWWGFIGFDECRAERDWSSAETEVLKLAARTLGAAISRGRAEVARAELVREQAARAEALAAQRRLAFLADASELLASSLDYETTLEHVARLAVSVLADWCVVDVVEADGSLRRLAVAHVDPARAPLAREVRRYPPDPARPYGVARVLQTGQTELVADVPEALLVARARSEAHLQLLRALGFRSSLIAPLVARDRILGAISFVRSESGRYTQADIPLAEELARRCAVAIDNARLYREAQQAIEARNEFLSVAAHELKTPMTAVLGYTQLLARRLERSDAIEPRTLARELRIVERQAKKLARLADQLLDVARLETGRLTLAPVPTDLSALVRGVVSVAQLASSRDTFHVCAPEQLWAEVDALRVEQVVANLIDNALRYSADEGPIEIELSAQPEGWVCLEVRDHGPGIPEDSLERVFDRFYRVDPQGHRGGLGLGLSICKQIVELHGGTIRAERPVDGGARLRVLLPATATSRPGR